MDSLTIIEIIFWICISALSSTYVIYPLFMSLIPSNKKKTPSNNQLPNVSILCAAYNEDSIIEEKIKSIIDCEYPKNQLEFWIGNDGSTDETQNIIDQYSKDYPWIKSKNFGGRNGKPKIIDQLLEQSAHDIIISTDANIIFKKDTIHQLVQHFEDPKVGLVDSIIQHRNIKKDGISEQEKSYINIEAKIKHSEGKLFGTMMGPFGACFAMRKSLHKRVPSNFLVDDFHICMNVLKQGYKAINELNAIVVEDVSNDIKEEIRRKKRIATGNIQNLMYFKGLWMNPFRKTFIPFLFHKVIRWFGPFLLIITLLANAYLAYNAWSDLYILTLFIQLFGYTASLFDQILKKIGIHTLFLRFISHFIGMNWALLLGFIAYINGVKSNVWEPTKRNQ